ncbi:hypothetical protein CEXT_387161 [Caerostris extrusa]|uniref:Uncharacterized protein n=1 Tax=Caerostris extrusa TaxID=172846 RepID=A0AAV4P519_CAEEX|nr:hypothetical protein CEXT_387161 [Caerostris extrusa]
MNSENELCRNDIRIMSRHEKIVMKIMTPRQWWKNGMRIMSAREWWKNGMRRISPRQWRENGMRRITFHVSCKKDMDSRLELWTLLLLVLRLPSSHTTLEKMV